MSKGGNATGWRKREIEDAQAEDEAFGLIGLRCAHGVQVEDRCSACSARNHQEASADSVKLDTVRFTATDERRFAFIRGWHERGEHSKLSNSVETDKRMKAVLDLYFKRGI